MRGYSLRGTAANSDGSPLSNVTIEIAGPSGQKIVADTNNDGNWDVVLDLFKSGGGEESANEMDVPFLGSLPFDPGIVRGGDDGVHRIVSEPDGATAEAFEAIVTQLISNLEDGEDSGVTII